MRIKNKRYYLNLFNKNNPPLKLITNNRKVVIFGGGRLGIRYIDRLNKAKIKVKAIIDNNKKLQGKYIGGIPVINVDSATKKYKNCPIIIASVLYANEIFKLLHKKKFKYIYPAYYLNIVSKIFKTPDYKDIFDSLFIKRNQEKINRIIKLLSDNESKNIFKSLINYRLTGKIKYILDSYSEYGLFNSNNIFRLNKVENYVDCGAYDGDTLRSFGKAVGWQFNRIYAFEPDKNNFNRLKHSINELKYKNKIESLNIGIFSKTGSVSFETNGTVDSKINNKINSGNQIRVITLDDYFKNKRPPTLIKMDIEGAEIPALMGAKKIIAIYKPKLAISIYHKPTDLWRIILLIKSYNKKYLFYIRHFTKEFADTMCLAI